LLCEWQRHSGGPMNSGRVATQTMSTTRRFTRVVVHTTARPSCVSTRRSRIPARPAPHIPYRVWSVQLYNTVQCAQLDCCQIAASQLSCCRRNKTLPSMKQVLQRLFAISAQETISTTPGLAAPLPSPLTATVGTYPSSMVVSCRPEILETPPPDWPRKGQCRPTSMQSPLVTP
jgi:hypothetical protein